MTSLGTLILKLHSISIESQFYLSQFLRALVHLPAVWRNIYSDLHLTSLTLTVLRLTRQLRSESLIRIGAPPLIKLKDESRQHKVPTERNPIEPAFNIDFSRVQEPTSATQERFVVPPNALAAITRRLFRTTTQSTEITAHLTPQRGGEIRSPTPPPELSTTTRNLLSPNDAPEEENLRDLIVETWLQHHERSAIRPSLSFGEAHLLYREMYEEYVKTGILPPTLFTERFLETRGDLDLDQARTDLRARLRAPPDKDTAAPQFRSLGDTRPLPLPLLPSYIPTALHAKGSLAFGTIAATISPPQLKEPAESPLVNHPTRTMQPINENRVNMAESTTPLVRNGRFHASREPED